MNYRILLTASLLLFASACGTETKDTPAADAGNTSDAQLGDTTADSASDTVAADTGGVPDTTATDASDVLDAGGDAVAPLHTTCVALSDCVAAACKTNAKDCEKPCLAAASADALTTAVPLLGCIQGQCTQGMCKDVTDTTCMDDCLGQKCGVPLTACVDDGKAGAGLCGEAMGCFDTCKIASGAPIACIAKCYNALGLGGKKALGNLLTCFQAKGSPDACTGDMIQCLVNGKTGDKGCYTFFGCQQTCGEGEDLQCIGDCAGQMTVAGQTALIDALPCFGAESTPACQAKMLACIAPTGTDSCVQTFDCIGKCPNGGPGQDPGPACIFECFHGGAADTIGLFTELTPCNDVGSDKSKCADGFVKCAKPAGTKNCGQVTTCLQTCGNQGPGCMLKCLAEGTTAAAADWKAAYVCTQACGKQCQGDKDPKACEDACNATKCLAEIAKCMPTT